MCIYHLIARCRLVFSRPCHEEDEVEPVLLNNSEITHALYPLFLNSALTYSIYHAGKPGIFPMEMRATNASYIESLSLH